MTPQAPASRTPTTSTGRTSNTKTKRNKVQSEPRPFDASLFRNGPLHLDLQAMVHEARSLWLSEALWPGTEVAADFNRLDQLVVMSQDADVHTIHDALTKTKTMKSRVFGQDAGASAAVPMQRASSGDRAHADRNLLLSAVMTVASHHNADPLPYAQSWVRLGQRTNSPRRAMFGDEVLLCRVLAWSQIARGNDRALKSALVYVLMDTGAVAGEMYRIRIEHLLDDPENPTRLACPGQPGIRRSRSHRVHAMASGYMQPRELRLDPYGARWLAAGAARRLETRSASCALATDGRELDGATKPRGATEHGNFGTQFNRRLQDLGLSPELTAYSAHKWRATQRLDAGDVDDAMQITGRCEERTYRLLRKGERPRAVADTRKLLLTEPSALGM